MRQHLGDRHMIYKNKFFLILRNPPLLIFIIHNSYYGLAFQVAFQMDSFSLEVCAWLPFPAPDIFSCFPWQHGLLLPALLLQGFGPFPHHKAVLPSPNLLGGHLRLLQSGAWSKGATIQCCAKKAWFCHCRVQWWWWVGQGLEGISGTTILPCRCSFRTLDSPCRTEWEHIV